MTCQPVPGIARIIYQSKALLSHFILSPLQGEKVRMRGEKRSFLAT